MTSEVPELKQAAELARALVGVPKERLASLMLDELEDDDVRWISYLMVGSEHPEFGNTLEDLAADLDPQPTSLERIGRLETELAATHETAREMGEIFARMAETLKS